VTNTDGYEGILSTCSAGGIDESGRAVVGLAINPEAISNTGGYFEATGEFRGEETTWTYGVVGHAVGYAQVQYGVYGTASDSSFGYGVCGEAEGYSGRGVSGSATGDSARGVSGYAMGTNAYAGYFDGRGYFSRNVGIGATNPNEKLTVEGALSLDEIAAPSADSGYGKVYVKSSDSSLYFKDDGGTEYDLTTGGDNFVVGDYLISDNDTLRVHAITGYLKLKETKIGRGGTLRIKFDLSANNAPVYVYAKIYRNGVAVGTQQSAVGTGYHTYSEDISGWSKGDLVQIYGLTTNSSYPVFVRNLRLYVDNPAEAGARL